MNIGQYIGQYKIVARLGEGGMGEVYRALDPRLNREVAVKVLHADALNSPDRRARFESEARAASALNHPNIVTIHAIGDHEGKPYLVTELIDGEMLRTAIGRGRMPLRRVLDIAVQVADGLSAAHAAGITHRDLKPENIMVTKDGRVKILDFGLAKMTKLGPDDATRVLQTEPGLVMGSVCYMSPEQATGCNVDYRSDQFSFGLVLHEMVSGAQTFRRDSGPETMAAIIRDEPPPLEPTVNAPLRWVIERLLAKQPEERYGSTRDLYRDLKNIREHWSEASSTGANRLGIQKPANATRPRVILTGSAGVVALGLVLTPFISRAPQRDLSAYRFTPVAMDAATEELPRWSPDGKAITYQANIRGVTQIFTKVIGAPASAQLTRSAVSCTNPFWAPDGSIIYYLSGGDLHAVSSSGGAPDTALSKVTAAAIHPDGKTFAFVRNGKAWSGSRDQAQELAGGQLPAGVTISALEFSPDGANIALLASSAQNRGQDWWIIPYPSGKARRIPARPGVRGFSWFPDSRHLATASYDLGTFRLSSVDVNSGEEKVFLADSVTLGPPSVSPDGKRVAFSKGASEWTPFEVELPDGHMRPLLSRGGLNMQVDWAPTGNSYLLATNVGGPLQLEQRSMDGFSQMVMSSTSDSLPKGVTSVVSPRWAPDGARFVFIALTSLSARTGGLWLSRVTGDRPIPIDTDADLTFAPSWSPDGEWLAYLRVKAGKAQIAKVRPSKGAAASPLADSIPAPTFYNVTSWSPDGKWIAYPGPEGLTIISPDGNTVRVVSKRRPEVFGFSKNGATLYAVFHNSAANGAEWQLASIDVATGAEKVFGSLDLPAAVGRLSGFSMHPDGKRFVFTAGVQPYDLWVLDGFQPMRTWMSRVMGR